MEFAGTKQQTASAAYAGGVSASDSDGERGNSARSSNSSKSTTDEDDNSDSSDSNAGQDYQPAEEQDYLPGTFEGPEKTMEIIFRKGVGREGEGLRCLNRRQLDRICAAAKCTIMSKMSNRHLDAYVLSESSLFVYPHRLVMKTCGTTTLLRCIGHILNYADELGMECTWLGYSRKNLFHPDAQQWPHSSFGDEMNYLDTHEKLQSRLQGFGHILGPITGDHWFVYVADLEDIPKPYIHKNVVMPTQPLVSLVGDRAAMMPAADTNTTTDPYVGEDRTINMMMFDMAPSVASQFYIANSPGGGTEMTQKSGIATLCPGAKIDEKSFTPCGYSMNAILHESYYTIHITPEPECSYVSFETNASLTSYSALIRNVLGVFKPRRFLLTTFGDDAALRALKQLPTDPRVVPCGHGVYNRTNLASSSMANGEEMCYLANYSLDADTAKGCVYTDGAELLPETVPAPAFPHGFRQRIRGQSLGEELPDLKFY